MRIIKTTTILLAILISSNTFAIDSSYFNKNNPACIPGKFKTSNYYMATNWYINSPASKALYTEVFAMGLNQIQNQVKTIKVTNKPWGVIFDIDETILNNMQYANTYEVQQCKDFSEKSWLNFVSTEVSIATPGSTNITCNIQKLGGKVILITERLKSLKKQTIENLNKVGVCYDNLILAQNEKDEDKNNRFNAVLNGQYNHIDASNKNLPSLNVIAYFGDNIQDFPDIKQKNAIKEDANSQFFKQFGTKYFSLTNPVYGSWVRHKVFNEDGDKQISRSLHGCTKGVAKSSNLYWAAKWYLSSAEVMAQYNEIFNNAFLSIQDKVLTKNPKRGKWGAVFAIDGTLLNNPTYLKDKAVLECRGMQHDATWYNSLANSIATPRAHDITCNIRKLGGHVVLVTNREINQNKTVLKATIDSLHKNRICFDEVLFASTENQEKSSRFAKVAAKMDVFAYFGSKIADFPDNAKENNYNKFGQDYFMLPNPVYGN